VRLFGPAAHEPLTELVWDDAAVRAAIAAVAADAEAAFDPYGLWALHPLDEYDDPADAFGLYLGASGAIWALHRLEQLSAVERRRDWAPVAGSLPERYAAEPELADELGGPLASVWFGEAGILLVAHMLAPAAEQERRLLGTIRRNAENPARELLFGPAGTMLAAQVMWERTAAEHWLEAWRASADWLWEEWRDDVWRQELAGRSEHVLGAAHGFAGNVFALARGDLLGRERRTELEARTLAALRTYARREEGLVQWPIRVEGDGASTTRTQWCHGAPGIVSSVAAVAPGNPELTELLVAGGELTWRAGPLVKGAGLCHGTAGNGYAFLKLFERTGDEVWLHRARRFGMHAIEQVERARTTYGRGRHTLWSGDLGTALYLQSCLDVDAAFPTLDVF
jgi:lanthionine synthetase-like protein